jgi:hypothetical protein
VLKIPSLKKQVTYKLLQEIDEDCKKLCAKKDGSILREKKYPDMIEFEWSFLLGEMSKRCPFLRAVLVTAAKCANKNRNHVPPICLCYSILLQQRNRDLNLVQRINTVLLSEGKAKKQVH